MNAISEWYEALSSRDQKVVQYALPTIIILFVLLAIVAPAMSIVSDLRKEVNDNKQAVILLQGETPQTAGPSKKNVTSLSNLITQTARQNQFRLDRYEERKTGEINVWFDDIPFDQMLSWLADLENQYGVTTSYLSISQTNQQGLVRANIRLTLG